MVENLKVTHYRNGTPLVDIPNVTDDVAWSNLSTGAYCDYDNLQIHADTFGHLYNWYAVNDSRKLAPAGWHVANILEWQKMYDYLDTDQPINVGARIKAKTHWPLPNTATNVTGFTALPSGYRKKNGVFDYIGFRASWWTSDEDQSTNNGRYIELNQNNALNFATLYNEKQIGYSIRCIKGE